MDENRAADAIRLDVHTHLIPAQEARLFDAEGVARGDNKSSLVVDGAPIKLASLFQPEDLLAWMRKQGIGEAWISIPPPVYRPHLQANAAFDWANRINEGLCLLAQAHPRLGPLLHLPVEHPDIAAKLALEWLKRGYHRFSMSAGAPGLRLSDEGYRRLWGALAEGRSFLFLHPGDCSDLRLERFYLGNLLGNPYETTLAAAHLILAGVPARYCDLKICLAHGGGLAALLEARLTRGFETARPGLDLTIEPPRTALRRMFVDAVVHRPEALAFTAQQFGEDRIVFGSDWPFPMGLPEPHEQLRRIPDTLREKIFRAHPDAEEK